MNATDATNEGESLHFRVIKISLYALILLFSFLGNGSVIFIIATNKRNMRTASNLLVMNLAACDLLTPLISIPFDFAVEESGYWLYGAFFCKILYPMATFTSTSSALTLAAIALCRYRILMHPYKIRLTPNQVKVIILSSHVFSTLVVSPYISVLHLEKDMCLEKWPEHDIFRKLYTICLFLVQYCIPLVFMVVMYGLALKSLYMVSEKTRQGKIGDKTAAMKVRAKVASSSPLSSSRWMRRLARGANDANKRATKMFIIIVIVFAIFMFPNQVIWLWYEFADSSNSSNPKLSSWVPITCWLFTYTNSVVNPLIYALMSPEFRKGFKHFAYRFNCIFALGNEQRNGHNSVETRV